MPANKAIDNVMSAGNNEIGCSWAWFLALGIALMLFGAICIVGTIDATLATEIVFGWLLLITGIAGLVHSFLVRAGSGFFLCLLSALFRGFTGYLLIRYPATGAAALTLVTAMFFIVAGLFRVIGTSSFKLPSWGWAVFSGFVSLTLGILLVLEFPVAGIGFIGFALGVDMLAEGISLVAMAVAANHSDKHYKAGAPAA